MGKELLPIVLESEVATERSPHASSLKHRDSSTVVGEMKCKEKGKQCKTINSLIDCI